VDQEIRLFTRYVPEIALQGSCRIGGEVRGRLQSSWRKCNVVKGIVLHEGPFKNQEIENECASMRYCSDSLREVGIHRAITARRWRQLQPTLASSFDVLPPFQQSSRVISGATE
jgi:hypothetical protein